MAKKKDSIDPRAYKDVDYMDPEKMVKKEKKSLTDTAKDLKFWAQQAAKAGKSLMAAMQAFYAFMVAGGWVIVLIIVVILMIIGWVLGLNMMPAMMQARLRQAFKDMFSKIKSFYMTDAAAQLDNIDYSEIVDVANYLEDMGYDLIGYGFVTPQLDVVNQYKTFDELIKEEGVTYELNEEDNQWHLYENGVLWVGDYEGIYYNTLGIAVDNKTNKKITDENITYTDRYGIIRSTKESNVNGEGILVSKNQIWGTDERNSITKENINNYRLLKTYLLSDYRIYTLRNNDNVNEGILTVVFGNIKRAFGSYQDAWARGLINVYRAEKGIAKDGFGMLDAITGDSVKVDRETMTLKNGYFNNPIKVQISGWTPRYGLSLEFLLSLHLGTMAPDLVYAMVQSFDTEIQVYLEPSAGAIEAEYKDPGTEPENPVTLGAIENAFSGDDAGVLSKTGAKLEMAYLTGINGWADSLILNKRNCLRILKETGLTSPETCTGVELSYVVETESSPNSVNTNVSKNGSNYLKEFYGYDDPTLENITYSLKGDSLDDLTEVDATNGLVSARFELSEGVFDKSHMKFIESDKLEAKYNEAGEGKDSENKALQEIENAKIKSDELNSLKENLNNRTFQDINSGVYRIAKSEIRNEYDIYGYYNKEEKKFYYLSEEEADGKEEINGYPVEEQTIEFNSFLYYVYQDASKFITEDDNNENENKDVILVKDIQFVEYDKTEEIEKDREKIHIFKLVILNDKTKKFGTDSISFKLLDNNTGEDLFKSGKASAKLSNSGILQGMGDVVGDNTTINAILTFPLYCRYDQGTAVGLESSNTIFSFSIVQNRAGEAFTYQFKRGNSLEDTLNYRADSDGNYDFIQSSNNIGEGEVLTDILWSNFVIRNKTEEELIDCGLIEVDEETGEHTYNAMGGKCSEASLNGENAYTKCCSNCQAYVRLVIDSLADVSDKSYKMFTPYIARVVGSWFRDTYFIVPKEDDNAIKDYVDSHIEYKGKTLSGNNVTFVQVDEEYLSDTGEYWTAYEMKLDANNNETSEYQLYYLNGDGTTSTTTLEQFLEKEGYANQKEAEADGHAFVKKAKIYNMEEFIKESYNMQNPENGLDEKILWSVYSFSTNETATNWKRVEHEDENYGSKNVDALYEIFWDYDAGGDGDGDGDGGDSDDGDEDDSRKEDRTKGIFYRITSSSQVTQEEEAQRGETNPFVKYLFKYRKFYIYDGTRETALLIQEDKEKVREKFRNINKNDIIVKLGTYGRNALRLAYKDQSGLKLKDDENVNDEVLDQWLEWQLDMYYMEKNGVDLNEYYNTTENLLKIQEDPRDPDLISIVNITKSSLNAFSILENVGTVDAEYQYRDFKELIVELNYFDKEDLSEKPDSVLTWILPDTTPMGWPNRPWDKLNIDYGALVQSKDTYAALSGGELEPIDVTSDETETGDGSGTGDEDLTDVDNPETAPDTTDTPGTAPSDTTTPEDNTTNDNQNTEKKPIEENKIVFLGDTWTANLQDFGLAKSSYVYGRSDVNADDFISNPQSIEDDASCIVIQFGLNDPNSFEQTQNLANSLKEANTDLPIFVIAASHVTSEYASDDGVTADDFNSSIDNYNNKLKEFCESKDGITFINPNSSILESGYLKSEFASSPSVLNNDGAKAWYNAIISAIKKTTESDTNGSTKPAFEGWESDQLVASPVTGKVIEYGTHTRMNIYTGKQEKVGYIVLEVLSEGSGNDGNGTNTGYFTDEMVRNAEYNPEEDTGYSAAEALNLFYKEYDTNCAGYTIMLDGFNVDLETVDSNGNQGAYEKNGVVALYNSKEQKNREKMEKAKEDAPYFINNGEGSIPSMENGYTSSADFKGFYVKEGKYIGKTTEPSAIMTYDTITPESIVSDYEGPADYIRIIMKDLDYSVVDNVEEFFNIPEPEYGSSGTTGGSQAFNAFESEVTNTEMEFFAAVICAEDQGNRDAQIAIAQVIKNRGNDKVHYSNYNTIFEILTAPGQYGTVFKVPGSGNGPNPNASGKGLRNAPAGAPTYDFGEKGIYWVGYTNGKSVSPTDQTREIAEGVLSGSIADEASAIMGKLAIFQVTAADKKYKNHDACCVVIGGELFAHNYGCLTGKHESCGCGMP